MLSTFDCSSLSQMAPELKLECWNPPFPFLLPSPCFQHCAHTCFSHMHHRSPQVAHSEVRPLCTMVRITTSYYELLKVFHNRVLLIHTPPTHTHTHAQTHTHTHTHTHT